MKQRTLDITTLQMFKVMQTSNLIEETPMSNHIKDNNREEIIRRSFDKGQQYGIDYNVFDSAEAKEEAVIDCMEEINTYLDNLS